MAHEISIRQSGFAEMAFVGATPWHGLGQNVDPNSTIEQWKVAAGLNWEIKRTPVRYENDGIKTLKNMDVLFRSDNGLAMSVVSNRYQVVQPGQILDFFNNLVKHHGFQIETAGALKEGRRIWALAKTGFEAEVIEKDVVKSYLLLVTSCDGGLATTAQFTSVRVVCNNTLQMSLNASEVANQVKVRHNTIFNSQSVQGEMGLNAEEIFTDFVGHMNSLANKSISGKMAEAIIENLLTTSANSGAVRSTKGFDTIMKLFNGAGKGSRMDGVAGTAWGLVNAVTEYTDFHVRARNQDNRLDSAWFGNGAGLKSRILHLADEV